MSDAPHIPVMPDETLDALNPRPGCVAVDATAGFLGHSLRMLERMNGEGTLVAISRHPRILKRAKAILRESPWAGADVRWVHDSYVAMDAILERERLGGADLILYDLGINSLHIDSGIRGFSFSNDGPLDMRFDPESATMSASDAINGLSEEDLADVFYDFGEDRGSRKVARAIATRRRERPLETTFELADVIRSVTPGPPRTKTDRLARLFQALRIFCNAELDHWSDGLPNGLLCLNVSGVCAALSYHSLEDRWTKRVMAQAAGRLTEIHEPPCPEIEFPGEWRLPFRKPKTPSKSELERNSRSRSAKLRAIERIA